MYFHKIRLTFHKHNIDFDIPCLMGSKCDAHLNLLNLKKNIVKRYKLSCRFDSYFELNKYNI